MEIVDHREHDLLQQRWRNMKPDRAIADGIVADVIHHLLDPVERLGDLGQQRRPGRGQREPWTAAVKQFVPEQFFKADDVPTDGALCDIERLGTGRKAEILSHGIECAQRV